MPSLTAASPRRGHWHEGDETCGTVLGSGQYAEHTESEAATQRLRQGQPAVLLVRNDRPFRHTVVVGDCENDRKAGGCRRRTREERHPVELGSAPRAQRRPGPVAADAGAAQQQVSRCPDEVMSASHGVDCVREHLLGRCGSCAPVDSTLLTACLGMPWLLVASAHLAPRMSPEIRRSGRHDGTSVGSSDAQACRKRRISRCTSLHGRAGSEAVSPGRQGREAASSRRTAPTAAQVSARTPHRSCHPRRLVRRRWDLLRR